MRFLRGNCSSRRFEVWSKGDLFCLKITSHSGLWGLRFLAVFGHWIGGHGSGSRWSHKKNHKADYVGTSNLEESERSGAENWSTTKRPPSDRRFRGNFGGNGFFSWKTASGIPKFFLMPPKIERRKKKRTQRGWLLVTHTLTLQEDEIGYRGSYESNRYVNVIVSYFPVLGLYALL